MAWNIMSYVHTDGGVMQFWQKKKKTAADEHRHVRALGCFFTMSIGASSAGVMEQRHS